MRNYKIACISTFIILLTGCNAFSSQTEETSLKGSSEEVAEVVKKEPVILDVSDIEKEVPIRGFYPLAIDEEIASPIGQSESYFTNSGDSPFKITLLNTGTESFLYKIQNLDKETNVAMGVLKSNESYEKVFDGFPEGAYVISYLVEEEGFPMDIKLKVEILR